MSKAAEDGNKATVLKTEADSAVAQAKTVFDNANKTYAAAKIAKATADADAAKAISAADIAVTAAKAALAKA